MKEKHAGGRPLKYKTIKDVPLDYEGEIEILNIEDLKNSNFNKEIDLVKYITNNIDLFAKNILNDKVIYYEIDKPLNKQLNLSPRGRRIDIYIKGENKVYIIETKNPKSGTENRMAIGQILDYGREFTDSEKELIIISTKFDINTAKTISYYNLPIRYICLSKRRCLEYERSN